MRCEGWTRETVSFKDERTKAMLRSRNFLLYYFSPLWCSSLIQVEFHFWGDKTRWEILNPIINVLLQKKPSPTWSVLQVSGGAQVLTGADKDLLLSNALIALKESWLGWLLWDVIPLWDFVFVFCDQRVSIIFWVTADCRDDSYARV